MCVASMCSVVQEIGGFRTQNVAFRGKMAGGAVFRTFLLCLQPQALQTALIWGFVIEKDFDTNLLPPK